MASMVANSEHHTWSGDVAPELCSHIRIKSPPSLPFPSSSSPGSSSYLHWYPLFLYDCFIYSHKYTNAKHFYHWVYMNSGMTTFYCDQSGGSSSGEANPHPQQFLVAWSCLGVGPCEKEQNTPIFNKTWNIQRLKASYSRACLTPQQL